MLGNTLIDNSQNLKLVDTLNEIINIPEIQEICIATGYWDLKGTALITESLKKFLEKAADIVIYEENSDMLFKNQTKELVELAKILRFLFRCVTKINILPFLRNIFANSTSSFV